VVFIISIVFCVFRGLLAVAGVPGYFVMKEQDSTLLITVFFEVGAGAAMATTGLLANSLMLARKPIGAPIAWLHVGTVVLTLVVALWQTSIMAGTFPAGSPQVIGVFVGAGIVAMIRLGILGLYCYALATFSHWARGVTR